MRQIEWPEKILIEGIPKDTNAGITYFKEMYLGKFKPEGQHYSDDEIWCGVDYSENISESKSNISDALRSA